MSAAALNGPGAPGAPVEFMGDYRPLSADHITAHDLAAASDEQVHALYADCMATAIYHATEATRQAGRPTVGADVDFDLHVRLAGMWAQVARAL